MKRLVFALLTTLAVSGLLMQCKDPGRALDVNISSVQNFFAPADGLNVTLQPATAAAVVFQWDQALAEDGTLVLYQVAFDLPTGDFSKPVFVLSSDQNGVQNQATVAHKDLNRIAALAGIGSLGTGTLKWTVLASRGVNVKQATAAPRSITLTRPAGFDVIPASVFLTGSATEAGTDLTKALPMRSTAPGVFEIYTSLKPGTYSFVDKTSGTSTAYSISGVNIRTGGTATVTDAQQPYRLTLDFTNAAARVTKINEVGFWYSNQNNVIFTFAYAGGGLWQTDSRTIALDVVPWGKEDRYKFRLKTNTGGSDAEEWFGSSNSDNSAATSASPPSYFYLNPIPASQWDYSYKYPAGADGKTAVYTVSFAPTAPYSHSIAIK